MKLRRILAVALASWVLALPAVAADAPAGAPDMAAMMKEWQRLSQPGAAHKAMQKFEGTWDASVKMWYAGPGTLPTQDSGTATFKMIMGGRYLQQDFTGTSTMPDATGQMKPMPFHGLGITGYDNYRNMYTSSWVDDMSTTTMTESGSASPDGKVMHLYGQLDEPTLKVIGRTVHTVTRWVDDDHFVWEMYDLHAGPDYKVMEITYARKKS